MNACAIIYKPQQETAKALDLSADPSPESLQILLTVNNQPVGYLFLVWSSHSLAFLNLASSPPCGPSFQNKCRQPQRNATRPTRQNKKKLRLKKEISLSVLAIIFSVIVDISPRRSCLERSVRFAVWWLVFQLSNRLYSQRCYSVRRKAMPLYRPPELSHSRSINQRLRHLPHPSWMLDGCCCGGGTKVGIVECLEVLPRRNACECVYWRLQHTHTTWTCGSDGRPIRARRRGPIYYAWGEQVVVADSHVNPLMA